MSVTAEAGESAVQKLTAGQTNRLHGFSSLLGSWGTPAIVRQGALHESCQEGSELAIVRLEQREQAGEQAFLLGQ